jgi:hypothetical protein
MKRKTPLRRQKKPMARRRKLGLDEIVQKHGLKRASTLAVRAPGNKGWLDVTREIWADPTRRHQCEVCGVPIEDPQPINWSHLLPRGSYRRYKRDPRNIRLMCGPCHKLWHKWGPMILKAYVGWRTICNLYFELRDESNGIKKAA